MRGELRERLLPSMHSKISIIGDVFTVEPHNPEWEKVAAIVRDNPEEIVMIPKGSMVMVTNVLDSQHGETGWCHAIYNGMIVEIGTDLLARIE